MIKIIHFYHFYHLHKANRESRVNNFAYVVFLRFCNKTLKIIGIQHVKLKLLAKSFIIIRYRLVFRLQNLEPV